MFRHLFRLIWNRKRSNLLLLSEMFLSFAVLFGVGSVLIGYGRNYVLPRGFEHERVWRLNLNADPGEGGMPRPVLDEVLRQVRALPGVEDLSLGSSNTPFSNNSNGSTYVRGDRRVDFADYYDSDDRYGTALNLRLREGRWFRADDDASPRRPAVISQSFRDKLFTPDERAVGQVFSTDGGGIGYQGEKVPVTEMTVVGVVDDVRASSDFGGPNPAAWLRLMPHDTTRWQGAAVLVRVAPGQGAALQQRIVRTVGATRFWTAQVRTLEADRLSKRRNILAPLAGVALVGLFLIINVALGLFGVLWYNISQRRAEIGLRRAMGATGPAIARQFLLEVLLLAALGIAGGLVLAAQFPLLGVLDVAPVVYGYAMLGAAAFLFALAALCAWYPSRIAAGIQPAVALREE